MGEPKDWSPEDEVDPIELQKKQLALGQKFLDKIEAEERAKELAKEDMKRRQEEYEASHPTVGIGAYVQPTPPTFEERCAAIEKAWAETKRMVPDAPDPVKSMVFQTLLRSALNEPHSGYLMAGPG